MFSSIFRYVYDIYRTFTYSSISYILSLYLYLYSISIFIFIAYNLPNTQYSFYTFYFCLFTLDIDILFDYINYKIIQLNHTILLDQHFISISILYTLKLVYTHFLSYFSFFIQYESHFSPQTP